MNKIFNNKKLFYVGCIVLVAVILIVLSIVSLLRNKKDQSSYSVDFNITVPQVYISDFESIRPGCNDPTDYQSTQTIDPQIDILTVNRTYKTPAYIQHVVTVFAKVCNSDKAEHLDAGSYLDARYFYLSEIADDAINDGEDKYYILDNKTTVQADKYTETDGNVIAVRYYLRGSSLEAPEDEYEPTYSVDSYKLGLSQSAPMYYADNAEISVSVVTQASDEPANFAKWKTVGNNTMFSIGYDGTPIDTNNLGDSDNYIEQPTEQVVSAFPDEQSNETSTISYDPTASSIAITETIVTTTVPNENTTVSSQETTTPTETTTETTVTEVTTVPSETEQTETTTSDSRIYPESMSINTGTIELNVGDKYSFGVTFEPSNATETKLAWTTSNSAVADVSSSGTVTAKSAGEASIKVTSVNGMVLTAYVTVKSPAETTVTTTQAADVTTVSTVPEPVNVIISSSALSMAVGDTYQLSAEVYPLDIVAAELSWSSSNETVAFVSQSGYVQAIGAGTAIITVTTSNGLTAECTVNIQ